MNSEGKRLVQIVCPACGKSLTSADANERCPASLYRHGLHPIVVIDIPEEVLKWQAQNH